MLMQSFCLHSLPLFVFGSRAVVVIGGSVGGLITAAYLSQRFRKVVIIERDKLPSEAKPRNGVPQGLQPVPKRND